MSTAQAQSRQKAFWTHSRIGLAFFSLSLLIFTLLGLEFISSNSPTSDEHLHILAAYRYWQCGEFANNAEHPPLFKWVAGFPIRNANIKEFNQRCGVPDESSALDLQQSRTQFEVARNRPELVPASRRAMLVFGLILITAVYFCTRQITGITEAVIAALLCSVEPVLVSNGSLITSDMPITAALMCSVWASFALVQRVSQARTVLLGLALGFALSAKHAGVIVPVLVLSLLFVARYTFGKVSELKSLKLILLWVEASVIGIAVLWCNYGFRYAASPIKGASPIPIDRAFASAGLENSFIAVLVHNFNAHHLLPEAYLGGMSYVAIQGARAGYILGSYHATGVWYYFAVALVIKLTVGVLALFLLTLSRRKSLVETKSVILPLLVPATGYLLVAMAGKLNIGVRHVLPIVPIMIVIAAIGVVGMMRRSMPWRVSAIALLLWSLVSALYSAPAQLSYANELIGGSKRLHYYLADSNLDWGQSSAQLLRFAKDNKIGVTSPCVVATGDRTAVPTCQKLPTFGDVVNATELPPNIPEQIDGTLILQPLAAAASSAYVPWLNRRPDQVEGNGTILVFRGKLDLRQISAARHLQRAMYLNTVVRDRSAALEELFAAEPNAAESDRIEVETGIAALLIEENRIQEARGHAETGLRYAGEIPSYARQRTTLKQFFDYTSLSLGK